MLRPTDAQDENDQPTQQDSENVHVSNSQHDREGE